MRQTPFHLRYDVTRWQRLIPHLCVWGPMSLIIPAAFVGIILLAVSTTSRFTSFDTTLTQTIVFPVCSRSCTTPYANVATNAKMWHNKR